MLDTYVIGVNPETNESYIVMDRWGHPVTEERIASAFESGEIWSDRIYFVARVELHTDDIFPPDPPAPEMCKACGTRAIANPGSPALGGALCTICIYIL